MDFFLLWNTMHFWLLCCTHNFCLKKNYFHCVLLFLPQIYFIEDFFNQLVNQFLTKYGIENACVVNSCRAVVYFSGLICIFRPHIYTMVTVLIYPNGGNFTYSRFYILPSIQANVNWVLKIRQLAPHIFSVLFWKNKLLTWPIKEK